MPEDDFADDIDAPPESGIVAPLEQAATELALSERRVERSVDRMLGSLTDEERELVRARWLAPKKRRPV